MYCEAKFVISALVIWGLVCWRFSAETAKATKGICWTSASAPCNSPHCNSIGSRSVPWAKARVAPGQAALLLAATVVLFVTHQVNVLIMHVAHASARLRIQSLVYKCIKIWKLQLLCCHLCKCMKNVLQASLFLPCKVKEVLTLLWSFVLRVLAVFLMFPATLTIFLTGI